MRIPFEEVKNVLLEILKKHHFSQEKAELIAQTHTQSSCDGVYSHGLNRFPVFIDYVKRGLVKPAKEAECVSSFGALERWDGHLGSGVWNAHRCMQRALQLAETNAFGAVFLKNTNHWMRGGTYGWQAAEQGKIAICFTNTQANMPPWGGKEKRLGNNPFVVAIPRSEGHVVLDMSISQYSFGKMHIYKQKRQKLPFPGGWDTNGNLTNEPEGILATMRALPIGYWKGSAFSMVLDMLASLLSDGNPTHHIAGLDGETAISQVFMCIDARRLGGTSWRDELLKGIIDNVHDVPPLKDGERTFYPGEKTQATRKENLEKGIPVDEAVWNKILELRHPLE